MSTETLHPVPVSDVINLVITANRRCNPNSGQIAVLSTIALLHLQSLAEGRAWGASRAEVMLTTGYSESTVRSHIKFWVSKGALRLSGAAIHDTWLINLEA